MQFDAARPMDIIPVGRIAIDLNPLDFDRPLSESTTFRRYVGGSPANIAVGMARLGRRVGFLGRISDDQLGDYVQGFFEGEGIDVSHVRRCANGEALGLTFTEMLSSTQSSILMYRERAADLQLDPADVDEAYIAGSKMLLISGTSLAASPSREAALKALALAKKAGTAVVFDVDYRNYTWKGTDEITVYTALVARQADIILGSREEYDLMERFLGLDGSDAASSAYWLGQGARIAVVKHGKDGSTAYTAQGAYRIRPFPVDSRKGFGGGDGYASAFLHGLLAGWDIMDALEFGSASAAMLIASHACSQDMPTEDAIRRFIAEKKAQYGDMIARA